MTMLIYRPSRSDRTRNARWLAGMLALVAILVFGGNMLAQYLSGTAIALGRPFWVARDLSASVIRSADALLSNKAELLQDNQELRARVHLLEGQLYDRAELIREQTHLREALGRRSVGEELRQVARVLVGWREGPFDILTVDIGRDNGIPAPKMGDLVLAGTGADVWIGTVATVYADTSKIRLFSLAGETLPVVLGPERLAVTLTGRGNGNLVTRLPLGVAVRPGDLAFASAPDRDWLVAVVGAIVPDDNGAEQSIFLRQPVSAATLKYVEFQSL